MFDLISIGDCTIDHFYKIHDAHIACNIDKTRCELCINYADKLVVDEYSSAIGGNSTNNVVGSSRLKLKTAFYTNVGDDAEGQKVIEKMKEEGVDTRYIKVNKGMNSNTSAVIFFQGERTILVYHQPWEYNLPDLDRSKWVYFSSLSHSFVNTGIVSQIENYIERTGAKLAFNPGTFQLQHGVKKYPRLLSLTKVILVNLKEAKVILKKDEKVDIKALLRGLCGLGPEMAVITDGANGSYGYDGEKYYQLGVFPAELVEMTGAGDAYATGVVSGLLYGEDLPSAMRWGAANSASVVEHIGPQEGLLTYEEMQERLKKNSKIVAKKL